MNRKYLWSTAGFMIFLVLTIPFISSNALASLTATVNGQDGVSGFVRDYDFINVTAHSSYSISAQDIELNDNTFTECSPSALGGTDCAYFVPPDQMAPGQYDFRVTDTRNDEEFTGQLHIDGTDPAVATKPVNDRSDFKHEKGNITVEYEVTHVPVGGGTNCPGIDRIEFVADGTVVASKEIGQDPFTCSYSEKANFHVSGTGNKTICIRAYDNLEQSGDVCARLYVDNEAPGVEDVRILRASAQVTCSSGYSLGADASGKPVCISTADPEMKYYPETEIDYASSSAESVYVEAVIDDGGTIVDTSVKADLSALMDVPAYKQNLRDVTPIFSDAEKKTFTWRVNMQVFEGGTKNLVFKAKDEAGNQMEKTVPVELKLDAEAPEIVSITTDKCRERCAAGECSTVCFVGPGWNNVIVKVMEEGSGLDFNHIYLELGAFNEDYINPMRVAECKPGWVCEGWFQVGKSRIMEREVHLASQLTTQDIIRDFVGGDFSIPTATGQTIPISVVAPSQDDAGNIVAGNTRAAFVLDKDAPQIEDVEIKSITDLGPVDHHQSGDMIHVVAEVSDYTPVTAVADFSDVAGAGITEEGYCEYDEQTGKAVCEWSIGPILNGYKVAAMQLNFTDFVGNSVSQEETIEILETGEESKNLWYIPGGEVVLASAVSRATAQVTPSPGYPVYFSIPLKTEQTDARILSLRVAKCVLGENKYYLVEEDPELINDYGYGLNTKPGSETYPAGNVPPVTLLYHLSSQPMPEESVQVRCSLLITSNYRGEVTLPEEENVTLQIDFFDANLGEPDEALEDKLKKVEDNIFGWQEAIKVLKNVLGALKATCNLLYTIMNVLQLIGNILWAISEIFSGIGDGLTATGIFAPFGEGPELAGKAACGSANAIEGGSKTIFKVVRYACDIISCRRTLAGVIPGYGNLMKKVTDFYKFTSAEFERREIGQSDVSKSTMATPVQNTLGWSILTLCIPGIIENYERLIAIDCEYYKCIQTVPDGVPVQVCEATRGQARCQFVVGEILALIPFVNVLNAIGGMVQSLFANPLNFLGLALGLTCVAPCWIKGTPPKILSHICGAGEFLTLVLDVYSDIAHIGSIGDTYSSMMYDSCRDIKKGFPQRGEEGEDLAPPEEEGEST